MTDGIHRLTDRRTVLKGAAGAAGLASLGGLGLLATSPIAATTSNLTINDTSVENDTGDLGFVDVDVDVRVEWTGFEVPVHYLKFHEYLDIVQGETVVVEDHLFYESGVASLADHRGSSERNDASEPGTSGWIEAGAPFRVVAEDPTTAYHAETPYTGDQDLEPSLDGGELTSALTFSKFVTLYDENQDPLTGANAVVSWAPPDALAEGHFDVTVGDIPAGSTSGGNATSSSG